MNDLKTAIYLSMCKTLLRMGILSLWMVIIPLICVNQANIVTKAVFLHMRLLGVVNRVRSGFHYHEEQKAPVFLT